MMKRVATALAALLLLVAGCGKNAPDPGAAPASSSSQTGTSAGTGSSSGTGTGSTSTAPALPDVKKNTPKPVEKVKLGPLAVGAVAKVGLIDFKLEEIGVVTKAGGLAPGYGYLVTKLTVTNNTADPYTINPSDHIKVETPEGKLTRYNVAATAQRNPRLQGTLNAGQSESGWLGYMVKLQAGNFKMTLTHPDFGEAVFEFTVQ